MLVLQVGSSAFLLSPGGNSTSMHVRRGWGSLLHAEGRLQVSCRFSILRHLNWNISAGYLDVLVCVLVFFFFFEWIIMNEETGLCADRFGRRTRSTSRQKIKLSDSSGNWPSSRCSQKVTRFIVSRWVKKYCLRYELMNVNVSGIFLLVCFPERIFYITQKAATESWDVNLCPFNTKRDWCVFGFPRCPVCKAWRRNGCWELMRLCSGNRTSRRTKLASICNTPLLPMTHTDTESVKPPLIGQCKRLKRLLIFDRGQEVHICKLEYSPQWGM